MKAEPNYVEVSISALLDHKLKPTDLRIWAYLSWRQGDKKNCWPSERRIAKDLHLALWTVELSLARLRRLGYLTVRRDYKYHRQKNTYTVNLRTAPKAITEAQHLPKEKRPDSSEKVKQLLEDKMQARIEQQRKTDQLAAENQTTKDKERQAQNGAG